MTTQALESVQFRLAQHYLHKLRQANRALQHSRAKTSHWYSRIEQDWSQIKNWQQWTVSRSADSKRGAQLCAAFGTDGHEYVSIRQSPMERLVWYRQALSAAQHSGDSQRERQLLYLVGSTAYQTGSFEEAEQCAQQSLEVGEFFQDQQSLGYGWFLTGNLHSHRTELDAAEAAFRKAVKHFESCFDEIMTGHSLQGIARIMIFRGQYAEALQHATRYLGIIESLGRRADLSLAYHTLSNIHTRLGNLNEAKNHALKAVEISRETGHVRMIPSNLLILGYAELALGELDSAWEHFQETITASRANSSMFDLTAATYSLGDVRRRQNNYSEAVDYFQQALHLAKESGIGAYKSLCSIEIAYVHALHHELDEARIALREGAESALQSKSNILMAKALIPAMKLWQAMDDPEPAAEWSGLLARHPEHAEPKLVAEICREIEAEIGAKRYQAAVARGQEMSLDTAVKELVVRLS
jgi:tetratricopeptide (TPR) repeat protein